FIFTMEDGHESKKGQYSHWSEPEHNMLLRLLVDAIKRGWRDANGSFNKLTIEKKILSVLNQKIGSEKNYSHYKNRMKILKTRYQRHSNQSHLRDNSFKDYEDLNLIFGSNTATGKNDIGLSDSSAQPSETHDMNPLEEDQGATYHHQVHEDVTHTLEKLPQKL
ncbi:unnamed protein product, partial [Thlaspi arvense]